MNQLRKPTYSHLPFTSLNRVRYFEDYEAGAIHELGNVLVDRDEMKGFASKYDPQKIHTDESFARSGPFGELIASGWQTAGLMMRLYATRYLSDSSSIASSKSSQNMLTISSSLSRASSGPQLQSWRRYASPPVPPCFA